MNRVELSQNLSEKEYNLKVLKDNLKDVNNEYSKKENIHITFREDFRTGVYNKETSINEITIDYDLFRGLLESQINIEEHEIKELANKLYS